MSGQIHHLKWKNLISNKSSCLNTVFSNNQFADVTLVSDDYSTFFAHKYVLSTFSLYFKDILLNNPHPHPLIYLRGIHHEDLYALLQLMYLGKAWVYPSDMKRFALAARDLQIKKLADNIRFGNQSQQGNDDENTNEDIFEEPEDETANENVTRNISSNVDETIKLDIPGSDESKSSKQLYKCEECEAKYKSKQALHYHTSSKHEGICYSCKYCGYKAKEKSKLKRHQESIHEGVKYSCIYCEYKATTQGSLKRHQESVHEGVRYECIQCDYVATLQCQLKKHKKSVHEGVKYSCDQCDYQATRKTHLRTHKNRKH